MNLTQTEQQFLVWAFGLVGGGLLLLVIYLAKGVLREQKGISKALSRVTLSHAITDKDVISIREDVAEVKEVQKDHNHRLGKLEYKFRSIE